MLSAIILSACRDDSKSPYPSISQGTIPLFTLNDDDSGIINETDLSSTKLSFTLDKEGLAPVTDIDVTIIYNNSVTRDGDTIIYKTVSEFPASISINKDQLLAAFPTTVLTADTLTIGDSFIIGGNVLLKDGTYLDGGYSPSVFTKKPVTLTYNVACTSNIPTGQYTASQNDEAGWFGVTSTKQITIEKVKNSVNLYTISDVSAGAYTACCGSAFQADQPIVVADICNAISVASSTSEIEAVQGAKLGSWDANTQTITVHYFDILNDGDGVDLITTFVKN